MEIPRILEDIDSFCSHQSKWMIIREEKDVVKSGFNPYERPINEYINNSVLNLDKPPGPTSHEVVYWVKKMLNVNKAGHSGTLGPDPNRVGGDIPR